MTADDRTIHQRIADASVEIAEACDTLTKSGVVNAGSKANSYTFIPIDRILAIVRRAQADNGVFAVFSAPAYDAGACEKRWSMDRESQWGKTRWQYANGHIDVILYGALGDSIEVTVPCEAMDNSDKLTNKLITNAERSLYRTLYCIDAGDRDQPGDDPEATNRALLDEEEAKAEARRERRERARRDPFFGKGVPEDEPDTTEGLEAVADRREGSE